MRIVLCLSALLLWLQPLRARADDGGYDGFITQALSAYQAGRWAEARSLFRRAHELTPTARTYRTVGMCSFNLGDYVDALQNLEAGLTDTRKPLTAEQRTQVSDLIAKSNAKLGRFRLKVVPAETTLLVDGAAPATLKSAELLLEPGHHELSASASGYRSARRELVVEPGDRATLDFKLEAIGEEPAPVAAATPAQTATTPTGEAQASAPDAATSAEPREEPPPHGNSQQVLGFVALGLGGAGLVTFGVTGGLALSKKGKLDDTCPGRHCGPAQYGNLDGYDTLKTIATVSVIAGGAFSALGLVLLLTAHGSGGADVARASRSQAQATLTPELGLGYAGIRGTL